MNSHSVKYFLYFEAMLFLEDKPDFPKFIFKMIFTQSYNYDIMSCNQGIKNLHNLVNIFR